MNDEWQDNLVGWTESKNIYPDGWNYLSIERMDGMFSVFINGVLQASVESDHFTTGRIGLGGSTYDQGNVRVYASTICECGAWSKRRSGHRA